MAAAAKKAASKDPLGRVRSLLGQLSDAVDALAAGGEDEGESDATEAAASPEAPTPNVRVALPWRGRRKPSR